MAWITKALLVGVLVFAALHLMTMAVIFAAPYIAALFILYWVGKFLLGMINKNATSVENTD